MITATHVYKFCKCPRKLYLDRYGDSSQKLPWSEFMQHKMQQGMDHEKTMIKDIDYASIEYEDIAEGAKKTYDLLKQGTDKLYQGVLMFEDLLGKPDLLEKKEGKSRFGAHHYTVCDIKLGIRAKEEYVMQVMFYCHLLEQVQERLPDKAYLLLGDGKRVELDVKEHYPRFLEYFYDIKEIVEGKEADVFITGTCKECPWRNSCTATAEKKKDLSLIFRMSRKNKDILLENGIKDMGDAAKIDVATSEIPLTKNTLTRINLQSKAIVEDRPIKIMPPGFPKREIEIYFDIEGDQETETEYLLGILVVKDGTEEYTDFTAESPEEEKTNWLKFIDFFKGLDDDKFVVYHYHSYEKRVLNKLKRKYGADEAVFKKIMKNLRDLFVDVIRSVYLPLYSYSIKPIARYIGFDWSNKDAGGAQSMLWYSEWLSTHDRKVLDTIIQYNKEDCIATKKVKEWLEQL